MFQSCQHGSAGSGEQPGPLGGDIENRLDRISIYGSIDLWKDKTGLKSARELIHLLDKVITELEKSDLSEKIEIVAADKVPCPF